MSGMPDTLALGPNGTAIELFTTVWRHGVDGELMTKWYEDITCRQADLLYTVTHEAFMAPKHFEATTCDEALDYLKLMMGPIHETDWGCVYSESKDGWYRPECEVISHPYRSAKETTEDIWSKPGGAVLIIFIVFLCVFVLWWGVGCLRIGYKAWPWTVWSELGRGRVNYKRQVNSGNMVDISNVNRDYGVDNDEDDEDIYVGGDNRVG